MSGRKVKLGRIGGENFFLMTFKHAVIHVVLAFIKARNGIFENAFIPNCFAVESI